MAVSTVQIAENSGPNSVSVLTASFATTAVAGNLVFVGLAVGDFKANMTVSGYTRIQIQGASGGNLGAACWYKQADGSEKDIVGSFFTASAACRIVAVEYSGLTAASALDTSADNEARAAVLTATCSTGPVTTTDTSAFAVIMIATDAAVQFSAGRTYTPSFTEAVWSSNTVQNARPGIGIAQKELTATATLEGVFNSSGTVAGDEMYGVLAIFKQVTTAAPGAPALLFARMMMGHGY